MHTLVCPHSIRMVNSMYTVTCPHSIHTIICPDSRQEWMGAIGKVSGKLTEKERASGANKKAAGSQAGPSDDKSGKVRNC